MEISAKSKPEFRVIIAGTRDFSDYLLLRDKCDTILSGKKGDNNIVIVSGTARGADRLGERYARERGYEVRQFPADWMNDEKKAGPIRNAKMADNADALIAFWDGTSRGTKHMIDTALAKGLTVRVINFKSRTMKEDSGIQRLREQTAQYAIEHITRKGMHTGYAWLRDSFNEYYQAICTPGVNISQESDIAHRQILAQKVAIDCIHALNKEQLQQLDKALNEIASETKISAGLHI
ncbi:MAG: DUF2493 domain-containing protein [Prevotella sp.]|nr:DUF2493 domain-containing protein [Prevotella sp.]